jgi:Spy/CpxP family protein refolding chaperone
MKTWIKRTLIGLTAVTVTLGGLAACGHNSHWRHGGHGWSEMSQQDRAEWRARMLDRVSSRLSLDEAQKQKLNTLADALNAQRDALHAGQDRSAMRAEFQSIIAGSTLDRAKAQSLLDAKTGAVQTHAPQVIAAAGDFFDSLRPEQQAQVREFLSKRRGHRGDQG